MIDRLRTLFHEVRQVGGSGLRKAPLIVFLILFTAFLDLAGVSLIAPFLGLIVGDSSLLEWLPSSFRQLLGDRPLMPLGVLLVALFAFKVVATFWVQGAISRMSESIRADLMQRLLSIYQRRSYQWYLGQNTADLVNRVVWFCPGFSTGFVGAGMRLMADLLVFLALGVLIFMTDWIAFVMLAVILGSVFFSVHAYVGKRAAHLTRSQARLNGEVIHAVNQSMGGLREIRMIGCEQHFLARMSQAANGMVDTTARLTILSLVPRHTIELAVVVFLVALVFVTQWLDQTTSLVPLLGVIGASAVRLMPASTSVLTCINQLRTNRFVVSTLAEDLRRDSSDHPDAHHQADAGVLGSLQAIQARAVDFSYAGTSQPVLKQFDFEIRVGETVGLMGPSGSGKSTLADLLLGLLEPVKGEILVNGRPLSEVRVAWQRRVAYIPQTPYMLDDSLRRNVALGVADHAIDDARVLAALKDASLEEFVKALPEGLDTRLGERGVRMSGGQRQRVSIARALYHDREFLVLDEATSALDVETEQEIIETIRALAGRKTMLIIAHRESTLSCCSRRITMQRLPRTETSSSP